MDDLRQRINEFAQDDQRDSEDTEAGAMTDTQNARGTHATSTAMILGQLEKGVKEKNVNNFSQNTVYEVLGFKHNLKYGPRSKLRKSCSRFLRFSYLMDFIALETLASIFVESVRDTFFLLRDLAGIKPDFELKPVLKNVLGEVINAPATQVLITIPNKKPGSILDYTQPVAPIPLFKVLGTLKPDAIKLDTAPGQEGIPYKAYKSVSVMPFDTLNSTKKDFDPLVHIQVRAIKDKDAGENDVAIGGAETDSEEEFGEGSDSTKSGGRLTRSKVLNLHQHWLVVEPSQNEFASLLRETLQDEGLVCLSHFERFSRHSDLRPYERVLESWDDRVCDGEWDEPDDF